MRVAQLAAILAAEEGADPERAAFLALWHDTQETRTGDLPHTVSGYLEKPTPARSPPIRRHSCRSGPASWCGTRSTSTRHA